MNERIEPSQRELIIDVLTGYTRGLDTKDLVGLRSIFLSEEWLRKKDGFQSSITGFDATQHLIGNHSIEVAGEDATARFDVWATLVNNAWEGGSTSWVGGVYDVALKLTGDGWKIENLKFKVVWAGGNVAAAMGG
jgi:hypothetical protein